MADNFSIAHKFTLSWEGGESDDAADRGGFTKFGVSTAFLTDIASTQAGRDVLDRMGVILPVTRTTIRNLTESLAASLFRWQMWDTLKLDLIPLRPAVVLYDAAVNSGPRQSVKFAQRGYNACVTYGQPLDADGIMGPATRKAMQQADTEKIIMSMLDQREQFYRDLVAAKPSQEVFLKGWLNRVTDLRRYVRGL